MNSTSRHVLGDLSIALWKAAVCREQSHRSRRASDEIASAPTGIVRSRNAHHFEVHRPASAIGETPRLFVGHVVARSVLERACMNLVAWLPALFLLGLASLALCTEFLIVSEHI